MWTLNIVCQGFGETACEHEGMIQAACSMPALRNGKSPAASVWQADHGQVENLL